MLFQDHQGKETIHIDKTSDGQLLCALQPNLTVEDWTGEGRGKHVFNLKSSVATSVIIMIYVFYPII